MKQNTVIIYVYHTISCDIFQGRDEKIIVSVDRIEEARVILIDDEENILSLPLRFFDETPKEGDVFTLSLTPAPEKKNELHTQIFSLFEKLKKKGETQE